MSCVRGLGAAQRAKLSWDPWGAAMKQGHISGTEDSRDAGPEHVHPLLLPTGVYLLAEVDVGPGVLVELVAIKQQRQDVNGHGAVGVQVLQIIGEALHQLWGHQGHVQQGMKEMLRDPP